jgi:hypothetical protein
LIQEVLFLPELKEAGAERYGRRIIKQIRRMFETIHKIGEMGEEEWKRRMEHQKKIAGRVTGTEQKEAQLIAKRMREWEDEYFRFIEEGIGATNNPAELTIRQSVLDRTGKLRSSRERMV